MHIHPFASTWLEWDAETVKQELGMAHALGMNSIRIGVPYDKPDTVIPMVWGKGCSDAEPLCTEVHGWLTNEMTQLLQIAADYDMKVLFTLFEWSDSFPAPGTAEYNRQVNYVKGLVAPFANDDRVLGWDIHNEPEHYQTWGEQGQGAALIINWAAGITEAVHSVDRRHPVTIGMGNYRNLWVAPEGKSLLDIVDFVSFHCYDAGGFRTQIDALQARTDKPILLEEMGWPTGPASLSRPNHVYDEATQQFLYRVMLGDAKNSKLVGVVQWMLQDTPIGTPTHYIAPTIEAWFGLFRRDGGMKPAAEDYRDLYIVPPLPSHTVTNVPLTRFVDLLPP
jgi:endo-1,4-beta-mannosidase